MSDQILRSNLDQSVNFINKMNDGYFEARYVRRSDPYFIVYLSSQTGCNKACRFCHLTATKQTMFYHTTPWQYGYQAREVLAHYDTQAKAEMVHFNMMARGEPLSNEYVINQFEDIDYWLAPEAKNRNLEYKYNISTILPNDLDKPLQDIFKKDIPAYIYYSMYSVNDKFRKRWLPKAHDVKTSLSILKEYQENNNREIIFHWAFIKDENDSESDVHAVGQAIADSGIYGRFNIVRYNPYSKAQGEETEENNLQKNLDILNSYLPNEKSKIVPRVGRDVYASCGTFIK